MYADNHAFALNLDIDRIWGTIGQWREYPEKSKDIAWDMALQNAKITLELGYDVVIPQIVRPNFTEYVERLEQLVEETGAELYEILLYTSKAEGIDRYVKRGKAQGFEKGYNPNGIIGRRGGIPYLKTMYDEMAEYFGTRQDAVKIRSKYEDPKHTYDKLIEAIN